MVDSITLLPIPSRIVTARAHEAAGGREQFSRLTFWQQSWIWDSQRSLLQAAGRHVKTSARWHCPPPPAVMSPDGLAALYENLHVAKHRLTPDSPVELARLILHAEGVCRDAVWALQDIFDTASAALRCPATSRDEIDMIAHLAAGALR